MWSYMVYFEGGYKEKVVIEVVVVVLFVFVVEAGEGYKKWWNFPQSA